jgi:hypothetical protein
VQSIIPVCPPLETSISFALTKPSRAHSFPGMENGIYGFKYLGLPAEGVSGLSDVDTITSQTLDVGTFLPLRPLTPDEGWSTPWQENPTPNTHSPQITFTSRVSSVKPALIRGITERSRTLHPGYPITSTRHDNGDFSINHPSNVYQTSPPSPPVLSLVRRHFQRNLPERSDLTELGIPGPFTEVNLGRI